MRPCSLDLRERVVSGVSAGETCRVVTGRFDVADAAVVKWSQRHRRRGSVGLGRVGGHRRAILAPHRA